MNKKEFVRGVREKLGSNADVSQVVEYLMEEGVVDNREARNYLIRVKFDQLRRTTNRTDRDIQIDLAAENELSYSRTYRITRKKPHHR